MPSMPVKVLPISSDDVEQALTYVSVDDPSAADRLLESILAALEQASHFPQSGDMITIGKRRQRVYYLLYVHPYNIFYRIIDSTVVVMRVFHERMDTGRHLP